MKWLLGLVLCAGCLIVPVAASAQAVNNSGSGSSGLSLQGSGGALQQPGSGFQGTSPQNLTAPSISGINQNPRSEAGSNIIIRPSETSTSITKTDNQRGFNFLQMVVLPAILIGAGFILWRQSAKL